ncbi:SWI5-dependent HO expression protein 4 [Thecaphora frezii]
MSRPARPQPASHRDPDDDDDNNNNNNNNNNDHPHHHLLLASLSSLHLADDLDSTAARHLIDAFSPSRGSVSTRAAAISALVQIDASSSGSSKREPNGDLGWAAAFLPLLLDRIVVEPLSEADIEDAQTALRFLAALYTVSPHRAQSLLTHPPLWKRIDALHVRALSYPLSSSASSSSSSSRQTQPQPHTQIALAVADLLNAALSQKPSRALLAADANLRQRLHDLVLSDHARPAKTDSSAAAAGGDGRQRFYVRATAIASGTAKWKLDMASGSDAAKLSHAAGAAKPQQTPQKRVEQRQRSKAEDERLYELVRADLLWRPGGPSAEVDDRSGKDGKDGKDCKGTDAAADVDAKVEQEYLASTLLTTLECLTYLSLSPARKDAIARDAALLARLRGLLHLRSTARRSVFPDRNDRTTSAQSSYDTDASLRFQDSDRYNTALQYGLASVILNLVKYPAQKTDEEKQMDKLQKLANAAGPGGGGDDATAADEEEQEEGVKETTERVEQRCERVVDAGLVTVLAGIALAGPPPASSATGAPAQEAGVNPSPAIRAAVAAALNAILARQDKTIRGKVVQQGGVRALLALSSHVYAAIAASSSSLAKSTKSPSASAASGILASASEEADLSAMQALARLVISLPPTLLFANATQLDAAVPLLATLFLRGKRLERFEASLALTNLSSLSPELARRIALHGGADGDVRVERKLEEVVWDEEGLARRSGVELLCNVLGVGEVGKRWSGKHNVRVLLALLEEEDVGLRQAAAACLAILSEGERACEAIWEGPLVGLEACLADALDDADEEGEGDSWDVATPAIPPSLKGSKRRRANRLALAMRALGCWGNLMCSQDAGGVGKTEVEVYVSRLVQMRKEDGGALEMLAQEVSTMAKEVEAVARQRGVWGVRGV